MAPMGEVTRRFAYSLRAHLEGDECFSDCEVILGGSAGDERSTSQGLSVADYNFIED